MIVVDTNVLVGAVVVRDPSALAVIERDSTLAAPALWRSEYRSALASYIRNRGLAVELAIESFAEAVALLEFEATAVETSAVLALVPTSPCSAYDLEFVALARSLDVPFVTFDRQVLAAFPSVAVHPRDFVAG